MSDEATKQCVKCPNCGNNFSVEAGLNEAASWREETRCLEPSGDERRHEDRVAPIAVRILLEDTLRELPVRDLSTRSIGIEHLGWRFEVGAHITFDIIQGYKIIYKGVRAEVRRMDDDVVGARFSNIAEEDIEPLTHVVSGRS